MNRISDSVTGSVERFAWLGSCSGLVSGINHAPVELSTFLIRVAVPSVDNAGWTEVVIPAGRQVLPDFISGLTAKVDASVDRKWAGADLEKGDSVFGAFGHPGFRVVSNGSFSCPNNYEVTI